MTNSTRLTLRKLQLFTLLAISASLLSGCGGTKVYNTQKTVVYRDTMYNITNVQTVTSKIEGTLADDSKVDLTHADKKAVERLLKENDSMFVRMAFKLDDQEMLYRANRVESWRDFKYMNDAFERASEDIIDLMKDKKDTQLELR